MAIDALQGGGISFSQGGGAGLDAPSKSGVSRPSGVLRGAPESRQGQRAGQADKGSQGEDGGVMQGAGRTGNGRFDRNECETCKNRKYQDGSDDPGVSFKSPTTISADQAATAVMGHEMEHVSRNRQEAREQGREVISQSVVLHSGICPECGRTYIAGGETRTVTAAKKDDRQNLFQAGMQGQDSGKKLDTVA